jgi:hypothetical protein
MSYSNHLDSPFGIHLGVGLGGMITINTNNTKEILCLLQI